jgi:hypothetical protein
MKYKDKNGVEIFIGDIVDVPDPNDTDLHNYAFSGTVDSFHKEFVTVKDGDGDYFDIEPERLEK